MKKLRDIGERTAIDRLRRLLPQTANVVRGPGDDCAVVRLDPQHPYDFLLTSDPVVEGVHFAHDASPQAVGHKAIGRVLSDLAAMGGEPLWALMNVCAPSDTSVANLDGLYEGAAALAGRHHLTIVGGDMAEGPVLELHVFALGRVPSGDAVLRSGAREGDALFVTGELGGSIRGRHLSFEPRLREGLWLRDRATSMIDLSDGLASDLAHIAEQSSVGALVDFDRIPVSEAAQDMDDRRTPLAHALDDGEDFELLFTVPAERAPQYAEEWSAAFSLRCTRIGTMTARSGIVEARLPDGTIRKLESTGHQHFGGPSADSGERAL